MVELLGDLVGEERPPVGLAEAAGVGLDQALVHHQVETLDGTSGAARLALDGRHQGTLLTHQPVA